MAQSLQKFLEFFDDVIEGLQPCKPEVVKMRKVARFHRRAWRRVFPDEDLADLTVKSLAS